MVTYFYRTKSINLALYKQNIKILIDEMDGYMKENTGYILKDGKLQKVSPKQRFVQWWYGFLEPFIIRFSDFMLRNEKRKKIYVGMSKPKALPQGVIISTEAACRFVDFIYSADMEKSSARMAVTDCVCQTALKKCSEPIKKDMALLYAADMYTKLKHTGIKEGFELIESAEKAKEMIRHFADCGLMHNVLYCNSSGKWTFVMCNCDDEICVPFRSYMAGRKSEMGAGPEIIRYDSDKCIGLENCGKCIERCILKATTKGEDNKSKVELNKCLGCGLCVSTCVGKARTLEPRNNYEHEDILTTKILLGQ